MKLKIWLVAGLFCATAIAWDAPKGTVPRSAPDKYGAHAENQGVGVGAKLLTASEARKALGSDLDHCCMIVEVALYPKKDSATNVSLKDFALRIVGQDIATQPSNPDAVEGKLREWIEPQQPKASDVAVTQNSTYSHGSTVDPNTGRRGSTTYESTGATVSFGVGGSPESQLPNTGADRRSIERKLSEKSLPQGSTATPVSGYLYFTVPQRKKVKYQLEYSLNGNKIVVALP